MSGLGRSPSTTPPRPARATHAAGIGVGLVLLAAVGPAAAEDLLRSRTIDRWRTTQGLPVDHVQAIAQDRDGYLWIGTEEGLVRFDGTAFVTHDSGTTDALVENSVRALAVGPDGGLWIGTIRGVVRYARGRFTRIDALAPLGPSHAAWTARDGAVWIAGVNGLARIDASGTSHIYTARDGLPDDTVLTVVDDRDGRVWAGTRRGLARLDRADGGAPGVSPGGGATGGADRGTRAAAYRVAAVLTTAHGLATDEIRVLGPAEDGSLAIGTARGVYRLRDGRVAPIPGLGEVPFVNALRVDHTGALWVGTRAQGVLRLVGGSVTSLTRATGLGADGIDTLFVDRHEHVWLGGLDGLARLRASPFVTIGAREGLPHDHAWVVREDRSGQVWVGTRSGLATVRDGRAIAHPSPSLAAESILALADGAGGTLWIGTHGHGLRELRDGRLHAYDTSDGLPTNDVRAVLEDAAGTVWVGTTAGLARAAPGVRRRFVRIDGPGPQAVHSIVQRRDGSVWAGIGGSLGLCRWIGDERTCYGSDRGLDASVFALHEGSDGTLWLATSRGAFRLAGDRFQRYGVGHGLHTNTIWAVIEDDRGDLWLSSNRGLARVPRAAVVDVMEGRRRTAEPILYGVRDGLRGQDFSGAVSPSAWRSRDGVIRFASSAGLVSVSATEPPTATSLPPVAIEQVLVNDRAAGAVASIARPVGDGRLRVAYAAPHLTAPERLRFDVRLAGLDREWRDGGSRREAVYTNLRPGPYVFEVRARDAVTGHTGRPTPLAITLQPRLHQTWWFRAAFSGGVLLLGVRMLRHRERQARTRERELSARVAEALDHVKRLRGLIPICSACKHVRDDAGYWQHVESYIQAHSEAVFSHGLCPDCAAKYFPGYDVARDEAPPAPGQEAGS